MYFQEDDLWLTDRCWIAADSDGQVALLETGGSNSIPPTLRKTNNDILHYYFSNLAPRRCKYLERSELIHPKDMWKIDRRKIASAGLYCYDHGEAAERNDHYRKLIEPTLPIVTRELPEFIRSLFDEPLSCLFINSDEINDFQVKQGEKRAVPTHDSSEIESYQKRKNDLWSHFINEFHLSFEKNRRMNYYCVDGHEAFCPDCFDQRKNYCELEYDNVGGESAIVKFFGSCYRSHIKHVWKCSNCAFETFRYKDSFYIGALWIWIPIPFLSYFLRKN